MRFLPLAVLLLCVGVSEGGMAPAVLPLSWKISAMCAQFMPYPPKALRSILLRYPLCCYYPPIKAQRELRNFCTTIVEKHRIIQVDSEEKKEEIKERTKNSPVIINVKCCGSDEEKTCGNGTSCLGICGSPGRPRDFI